MRDFAVKERTSGGRAALWADGDLSDVVHKFRRAAVALRAVEHSWHRPSVLSLHRPLGPDDLGMSASWMGTEWHVLHRDKCGRYVVNRSVTKDFSVIQIQRA